MDLYGSKHRYVHTSPIMEGMGISTMEGIGCFPVRSQGSMMRNAFPKKVCVKILGFPYHWKARE